MSPLGRACWVASCLALVGCGGAPEPNRNDNTGRSSGGEARPCIERAEAPRLAGLDGRWFFVEPGGDDVELVIELSGGVGFAWAEEAEQRLPVRVVPRDDGLTELSVGAPGGGEVMRVFLAPRGPGSAIAFTPGDNDARIARRATDVPAFLQGSWVLADPRGRRDAMQLDIQGDRASLRGDREDRTMRLFGLEPDGPTIDIVGQRLDRGDDFAWIRLQPVGPDVLIARQGDEDEFLVMHRPGAEPAWLAETRGPPAFAPQTSPPTVVEE